MSSRKKLAARRATWLAFGLIALAAVSSAAYDNVDDGTLNPSTTTDVLLSSSTPESPLQDVATSDSQTNAKPVHTETDRSAEATRAYKQALMTLSTLTAHPPSHTHDPSFIYSSSTSSSNSLLSSLLPNLQGQGPVASAMRIVVKLHQQSWLRRLTSGFGFDGFSFISSSRRKDEDMRSKAIKVLDLLQHSAELGNLDALFTLAQISLFPPSIYFQSDPFLAYRSYTAHATLTGNGTSQAFLAFFHSTGYHDVVPVDQAKAQLYYTFAALDGDKGAQMALGYRYWTGIGTRENCGRALEWYERASEQAMAKYITGPPGGKTLPQTATRLSDLSGGVYGPGASVASTGYNVAKPAIKAGFARTVGETWEDVLEYYSFNADRGETDFAFRLGKIFYQGSIYPTPGGIASGSEGVGQVPRDYHRARYYFLRIARQVWQRDPVNPLSYTPSAHKEDPQTHVGLAAASAAYLGRMYLRGEGVKADAAVAKMWFERGAEYGDREAHNGLGIIWRDGLVQGRTDIKNALIHLAAAAGQDLAEAQVNLGKYHFNRNEMKVAAAHFEAAIRQGSPFEAYYYLAEIHGSLANSATPPNMAAGSCAMGTSFHKLVAERGVWGDDLLQDADVGWNSGTDRGKEIAMLKWWIAAERGFEIAQNNLAFVLDQDKSILRLTRFSPITPSNDTARLALTQWTRSAGQRNVDALVKVGDYYYHGLGVSEDSEVLRLEKAARYYQSAADTQVSALAMWNLGWMYENGVGVPQDFHLAKRHYDLALETNSEAYLPVVLSLIKLHIRSIWHTLMGGKGGLSLWQYEDETGYPQQKGSAGGEIDGGEEGDSADDINAESEGNEDDGSWYIGKAKDEFHKRRRGHNARRPAGEEDPIQWARDRRNAENERDSDFGPEDYFEGALRGGHRGEEEVDEFGETMLLVILCILVSVLLYVRTRVIERMRRERQQQQQQPQGGVDGQHARRPNDELGVFPPPGDPAREDWAVLR